MKLPEFFASLCEITSIFCFFVWNYLHFLLLCVKLPAFLASLCEITCIFSLLTCIFCSGLFGSFTEISSFPRDETVTVKPLLKKKCSPWRKFFVWEQNTFRYVWQKLKSPRFLALLDKESPKNTRRKFLPQIFRCGFCFKLKNPQKLFGQKNLIFFWPTNKKINKIRDN